ncbi:MAG: DUF3857 domain-containing protein, partial [Spirochaetes bacterium]|nr:DUF3857 domain-containing protein [Spirochaetota bacterium]
EDDINLYKKISFLENKKIFHSLEDKYYNADTPELIRKAFQDTNIDETMIHMYFDLFIIKPLKRGGYTYLVHQIFKILDEEGKEKHGEIKIPSRDTQIIFVRNYTGPVKYTDGTDYKEHNDYYYVSLPDIKTGSVIEVCYQVFYPHNWLDFTDYFYFSPFVFQETGYALENTALVLIQDKDLPELKFQISRKEEIDHNKESDDDSIIHIFKKDKAEKLKKDYLSIPDMDLVPHMYVSSIPDWQTFYNWYWGKIQSKVMADHEIEQTILGFYENSKKKNIFQIDQFLEKVYYYIQKNITPAYDYLYYPESTEFIFSRKKGNTEERTLLMYSFLKNLKIDSSLILVRNNNFSQVDLSLVYPEAFNSVLLYVPGQSGLKHDYYIDLSDKNLPFGCISREYVQSKGIAMNEEHYSFVSTPGFAKADLVMENYATIITNSLAVISGEITYSGIYNSIREKYQDDFTKETKVLELINSLIERISIQDHTATNLDRTDKDLKMSFRGEMEATDQISVIFDKMELSKKYVVRSERKTPLKIYSPIIKNIVNDVTINRKHRINLKDESIKNDFGEYMIGIKKKQNGLIITRSIRILPQVINAEEYKNFLDFCRQIDQIEDEKLILE